MVARNPAVVLVDFPIALAPVVELADGDLQPFDEPADGDLRLLVPPPDEIDNLVPDVVRDPLLL